MYSKTMFDTVVDNTTGLIKNLADQNANFPKEVSVESLAFSNTLGCKTPSTIIEIWKDYTSDNIHGSGAFFAEKKGNRYYLSIGDVTKQRPTIEVDNEQPTPDQIKNVKFETGELAQLDIVLPKVGSIAYFIQEGSLRCDTVEAITIYIKPTGFTGTVYFANNDADGQEIQNVAVDPMVLVARMFTDFKNITTKANDIDDLREFRCGCHVDMYSDECDCGCGYCTDCCDL